MLLCMSEHEGFCVPLLEAMSRELPILAYAKAAVPETLGESKLLFNEKDYIIMAKALERLQKERQFRSEILEAQRKSLRRFDRAAVLNQFISLVNSLADKMQ